MFKPSLKRSVLNDKLCLPIQPSNNPFRLDQPKPKTINIPKLNNSINKSLDNNHIPSIIVPQELLIKRRFSNAKHYTHIFTPLSYDFTAYPRIVKQIISQNPNASQAGKISNQINFVLYQKLIVLWKNQNIDLGQQQQIQIHKFPQNIDFIQSNTIKNVRLFKLQPVIVLAIVFKNKITLFKVDEKQLKIQDLMIKYKLKNCRNINKAIFTQKNEIIFSGDNGQLSILSFMNTSQKCKQKVITLKSPILKKYLSSSAFDYSTEYKIRQISVNQVDENYIYVLTEQLKKSNYLIYCLKRSLNRLIRLKQQPKHIHQQSFIDIYKFNQDRNNLIHVDRIKQREIQRHVRQNYSLYGQGLNDGFSIIAQHAKSNQNQTKSILTALTADQFIIDKTIEMKNQNQQNIPKVKNPYYLSPELQLYTKCGYIIRIVHYSENRTEKYKQNFVFLSQPQKIPSTIYGQASLLQSKTFINSFDNNNKSRSNYTIQSLGYQNLSLMNNMIVFYGKQKLAFLKIQDLKKGIYQNNNNQYLKQNQSYYLELSEYQNKYQKVQSNLIVNQKLNQNKDGFDILNINNINNIEQHKYIRLFNNQKKWTVFDNQGQSNIYLFQLRHIILIYLHFKLQFYQPFSTSPSQLNNDIRFHSIIQKIIRIYGISTFIKSLIQILLINTKQEHEYFYVQKQFLLQIVRKQFDYQLSVKFDEWCYKLQSKQSQKIVSTQKILKFVWILLFQYQNKNLLITQTYKDQLINAQYFNIKKQFQQVQNKLRYSSYGYALQIIFFSIIEPIIYFKGKQFKCKNNLLIKCQQNLMKLQKFIKNKKIKYQNPQFNTQLRSYLTKSYKNINSNLLSNKKSYNLNNTISTNQSQDTLYFQNQDKQEIKTTKTHCQPSQILQKSILTCIKKIILIMNIMGVLSQKDSRQNLPNFIEILTNIKSQILIGDKFFKQELLINQKSNAAQIIHSQLVKQTQFYIPELRIRDKIDYLKFKVSRNILNIENQMSQTDLKSLNLQRLSSIITSVEISDLRQIFLGKQMNFDQKKYFFYIQFLSVCMSRCIKQIRELSIFKQQKLINLSTNISSRVLWRQGMSNLSIQKLIISRQTLQYNQQQVQKFYQQTGYIFIKTIQSLKILTGTKYYETQKYLDYMIQLLIQNFGYQSVLLQFIQIQLKKAGLLQKIIQLKKIVQKKYNKNKQHKPILKISKQKQFIANQKSTFKFFVQPISLHHKTTATGNTNQ